MASNRFCCNRRPSDDCGARSSGVLPTAAAQLGSGLLGLEYCGASGAVNHRVASAAFSLTTRFISHPLTLHWVETYPGEATSK